MPTCSHLHFRPTRGVIIAGEAPSTARGLISPRPGIAEVLPVPLAPLGADQALVRALHTGVSRGTEALVLNDQVPPSVADLMRAPFQVGERPGPVQYGYLNVGVVEDGPQDWLGRRVFCLFPHQDRYVVPVSALVPIPDTVPSDRAVLAGTVETAINILWDASPAWGDRVAIIGAGLIGLSVAALLRDFPLTELVLVDPDPDKRPFAASLGLDLTSPDAIPSDLDLVIHASATQQGLASGLSSLGVEGTLVEASWFGQAAPVVPLGADFHAKRLTIRSSQVGRVPTSQAPRRTLRDRLELALTELADPIYDTWLTSRSDFESLPQTMAALGAGELTGLMHVVDYPHV